MSEITSHTSEQEGALVQLVFKCEAGYGTFPIALRSIGPKGIVERNGALIDLYGQCAARIPISRSFSIISTIGEVAVANRTNALILFRCVVILPVYPV